MQASDATSHQMADLHLAMFSCDLSSGAHEFLLWDQYKFSSEMRYFCSPTEKFAAANRPSDDGDCGRMHVNTPTEINGT